MLFDAVAHTLEANQPYVEIKITYRVVSNTVDCTFCLPSCVTQKLRVTSRHEEGCVLKKMGSIPVKITRHIASRREVCFEGLDVKITRHIRRLNLLHMRN